MHGGNKIKCADPARKQAAWKKEKSEADVFQALYFQELVWYCKPVILFSTLFCPRSPKYGTGTKILLERSSLCCENSNRIWTWYVLVKLDGERVWATTKEGIKNIYWKPCKAVTGKDVAVKEDRIRIVGDEGKRGARIQVSATRDGKRLSLNSITLSVGCTMRYFWEVWRKRTIIQKNGQFESDSEEKDGLYGTDKSPCPKLCQDMYLTLPKNMTCHLTSPHFNPDLKIIHGPRHGLGLYWRKDGRFHPCLPVL